MLVAGRSVPVRGPREQELHRDKLERLHHLGNCHTDEAHNAKVRLAVARERRSERHEHHTQNQIGLEFLHSEREEHNHGDNGRECLEHLDEGHAEP